MGWFAGALGVALLAAVGAVAGLYRYFAEDARAVARELGEARGTITRLEGLLDERERELRALKIALDHALRPRPTHDELQRMAEAGAGGAVDVPDDVADRVPVP